MRGHGYWIVCNFVKFLTPDVLFLVCQIINAKIVQIPIKDTDYILYIGHTPFSLSTYIRNDLTSAYIGALRGGSYQEFAKESDGYTWRP